MNFNDKTIRVIKGDTLEVFFEFKNESSGCSFLRCTFTRDADFIATVSESSQMELRLFTTSRNHYYIHLIAYRNSIT